MNRFFVTCALLIFFKVSFAGEKLEADCSMAHKLTFSSLFDSLALGDATDKKSMLICEAKTGNPFAAILLAENYSIFKVDTIELYSLVNRLAKEGEHRSLTILGLSRIDPKLGVFVNNETQPDLMRWYSGDPYNYEEAAKFYHQYYYAPEYTASYVKARAYAYLYYANTLGNDIAKNYMDKLALKMDENEHLQANKIINVRGWRLGSRGPKIKGSKDQGGNRIKGSDPLEKK